jgi:alkanesulfonate monooxygenase SsuD/methylene tetrahydromethanopterin reductase-like flavin-dependent oxidoreductase (luciferase family)
LLPGTAASIDARFTARNRIEVTTVGLDGFTLSLAGHPRFAPESVLTVVLDGQALRHKGATAAFHRNARGWVAGRYDPAPGSKRPGAEGPLSAALAARHIYVYGTADAPPDDELKRRRETAAAAAEWSSPRSRLMLNLPVKADKDVTPAEAENANLVLFGTRQTNSWIAKYAAGLPLELNPGAADYGLVFIAPAGRRYVVVNSGLPWWTGADSRGALPWRVLQDFGDFVLFKGSLEQIVAQGRFDRDWKTPPDPAAKMRESGTVVVR